MRILDRERYKAFFKAYVICFIVLVGLYVVIDAFTNLDEFLKFEDSSLDLFRRMGRFYLIRLSEFYDRLCGVISMMAAIFTVTWMQKNNELLAMLAAGVGTKRVIRPVLISAVVVSLLAMANQEFILPSIGEELQKSHDDNGTRNVGVYGRADGNRIEIDGQLADRRAKTIFHFSATFPVALTGRLTWVEAAQALYVPANHPNAPLKGGWLLRGARIRPEDDEFRSEVLVPLETDAGFAPPVGVLDDLGQSTYFLKTDLPFAAVTRKRDWYRFATTPELFTSLTDPTTEPEWLDINVALHGRLLRPLLGLCLMFVSLPLVLGGSGRNMFINLGMSLGTSGLFYAVTFLMQYLAGSDVVSAELSAWAPLIGFGTFATARWDSIRT
jgi:lipopolysaccharide export system permease protein